MLLVDIPNVLDEIARGIGKCPRLVRRLRDRFTCTRLRASVSDCSQEPDGFCIDETALLVSVRIYSLRRFTTLEYGSGYKIVQKARGGIREPGVRERYSKGIQRGEPCSDI